MLLMFILVGFRSSKIGNDTVVYERYYNEISQNGLNPDYAIEMGYQYLNLVFSKFSFNFHHFLIAFSAVYYGFLFWFVRQESDNYFISALLIFTIFFSSSCNIIRQEIAMLIGVLAYVKLKENKKIIFIVLVLIASTIHLSALSLLLLLAYKFYPKERKSTLIFIFSITALSILGLITPVILKLLPNYSGYLNSIYAGTGYLGISISLIRNVISYLIIYNLYKDEIEKHQFLFSALILLMFFTSLGFVTNIFTRIADYFSFVLIPEIPNAFVRAKNNKSRLYVCLFCIFLILYFLAILKFRPGWNYMWPYEFWKN